MNDRNQDLGKLMQLQDGRAAVRYERVYPHAPERVWRALIEPDSIKAWFPTSIEGLAEAVASKRANGKLRFVFENDDGPAQQGELKVCEPERLLEYTWGDELLRFELSAAGPDSQHCKLVFTVTATERSQANRDATGWHLCLDNLRRKLAGQAPQQAGEAFTELSAKYKRELGSDFPKFLKGGSAKELARELPGEHLEGQLFKGANDMTVSLIRAERATDIAQRDLPKGGYLVVIEGAFELHMGGHQMRLTAGMDFHIPDGAHVRGKMEQGARVLFAAPSA